MQLKSTVTSVTVGLLTLALCTSAAMAHFVWIESSADEGKILVRSGFGELEGWDPDLADHMRQTQFWVKKNSRLLPLSVPFDEKNSEYRATIAEAAAATVVGSCDYGIIAFGGNPASWLRYTAKNLYGAPAAWSDTKPSPELRIELLAALTDEAVRLQAIYLGKPLADATIKATGPTGAYVELTTDENGVANWPLDGSGAYHCYVGTTVETPGEKDGKSYESLKDYTTLSFNLDGVEPAAASADSFPNLMEAVTSFGAAVSDGWLYVYSGHIGGTHEHSIDNLSKNFRRINVSDPKKWEDLPLSRPLQGLALVAHSGRIIRVGGMEARNNWDQEEDMHSTAEVAAYDPATKSWTDLSPLPEARSSHDAVVVGDQLYVVGGWTMLGKDAESRWGDTAWRLDLSKPDAQWEQLPKPPFKRRALSLATADGKVYVVGGLDAQGGMSTKVDVFDPSTMKWSSAPALPDGPMQGFSPAAVGMDGELLASPFSGVVYRLKDGAWCECAKLETPRFLHRLLFTGPNALLAVAGSSRSGHLDSVERVLLDD